jgi:hypothetical protein
MNFNRPGSESNKEALMGHEKSGDPCDIYWTMARNNLLQEARGFTY